MIMREYKTIDGKTVIGYEVLSAEDIEEKRKKSLLFDSGDKKTDIANIVAIVFFGFSIFLLVTSVVILAKALLMNI